jgi:hypothetical protein
MIPERPTKATEAVPSPKVRVDTKVMSEAYPQTIEGRLQLSICVWIRNTLHQLRFAQLVWPPSVLLDAVGVVDSPLSRAPEPLLFPRSGTGDSRGP